jgi:hypothetical protein
MKMDSVTLQGNDSVFYPMRRIGGTWECRSPYTASCFGKKIIISENWNIFINDADTIRIKTDAMLDDFWVCYSTPEYRIEARVIDYGSSAFLEVEDSVKTIAFQAMDNDYLPIEHLWSGKTIQISKHYGIVRGFDFTVFSSGEIDDDYFPQGYELAGVDNPAIGIQNVTWKDVWDFEPGDVIHVLQRNSYVGYSLANFVYIENKKIITCLEQENEENGIVCKWSVRENKYRREGSEVTIDENSTYETIEYIDRNEMFDKLPEEVFMEGTDRVASTNVMFSYNDFIYKTGGGDNEIIYDEDNQCWKPVIIDGYDYLFIKGLGGPYYSNDLFPTPNDRTLVYYKKGNTEWGTPLVITGINEVKAGTAQVVYRKATDTFVIDVPSCSFELMDLQGKVLMQEKIQSSSHSIPAGNIPRGLYVYRLVETGGKVYSGKIVK